MMGWIDQRVPIRTTKPSPSHTSCRYGAGKWQRENKKTVIHVKHYYWFKRLSLLVQETISSCFTKRINCEKQWSIRRTIIRGSTTRIYKQAADSQNDFYVNMGYRPAETAPHRENTQIRGHLNLTTRETARRAAKRKSTLPHANSSGSVQNLRLLTRLHRRKFGVTINRAFRRRIHPATADERCNSPSPSKVRENHQLRPNPLKDTIHLHRERHKNILLVVSNTTHTVQVTEHVRATRSISLWPHINPSENNMQTVSRCRGKSHEPHSRQTYAENNARRRENISRLRRRLPDWSRPPRYTAETRDAWSSQPRRARLDRGQGTITTQAASANRRKTNDSGCTYPKGSYSCHIHKFSTTHLASAKTALSNTNGIHSYTQSREQKD